MSFALPGMDLFKEEKLLPTEDGLGKLSNTANLIAIFDRSLKLTTNKLLQKENPETIRPVARTTREAMKFRKSKSGIFFCFLIKIYLLMSLLRRKLTCS